MLLISCVLFRYLLVEVKQRAIDIQEQATVIAWPKAQI